MYDLKFHLVNPWEAAFTYSPWEDSLGNLDVHNTTKNILNIVGCIPVASIVSGIARIIFALDSEEIRQQGSLNGHIFRGILEIGSVFGIALIIADIYFTRTSREQLQDNKPETTTNPSVQPQQNGGELTVKKYIPTRSIFQPRDIEPVIITEYRPGFSVIKDVHGRLVPTRLVKYYSLEGEETDYQEVNVRVFPSEVHTEALTPIVMIKTDTSPNKFFTLCEKQFREFKLHHACDKLAMNAFTLSAMVGNVELLKALIQAAPELVDLEDENGLTPLVWACCYEDQKIAVEMADLLIKNGADVNLSPTSFYSYRKIEININSRALYIAKLFENDALVELLLKNGAILDVSLSEESKKELKLLNNYPSPKMHPALYNLTKEQVNDLDTISNKVTWKKCMPLVVGHKNNEIILPGDVVDLIIRIYKAVTPFW